MSQANLKKPIDQDGETYLVGGGLRGACFLDTTPKAMFSDCIMKPRDFKCWIPGSDPDHWMTSFGHFII